MNYDPSCIDSILSTAWKGPAMAVAALHLLNLNYEFGSLNHSIRNFQ